MSTVWSGCGGGGSQTLQPVAQGTRAGTYTVNVQASSGAATQMIVLTVNVQ